MNKKNKGGEKMAKNKAEQIVQRKVSLAQQYDTWVVRVRTPDNRIVLRVARDADRGIRILRQGILFRFSAEEVMPLLQQYYDAVKKLTEAAQKICEKAGVPFKIPNELVPQKIGDPSAVEDAKVEKIMDVAYNANGGDNEEDLRV